MLLEFAAGHRAINLPAHCAARSKLPHPATDTKATAHSWNQFTFLAGYVKFTKTLSPNNLYLCRKIGGQSKRGTPLLLVTQRCKLAQFFHTTDAQLFNYASIVCFYRMYADVESICNFFTCFCPANHGNYLLFTGT